ncbi:MAG TPA: hypothetical protein VEW48_04770 [Thermoanaerobaculia bacterium]|nr:hypothetical protein [Thermoanaerobaculia bacterium]
MRLYECDAHLEWARLCRDQGDLAAARRHVARELVNETGYGRLAREVGCWSGPSGRYDLSMIGLESRSCQMPVSQ